MHALVDSIVSELHLDHTDQINAKTIMNELLSNSLEHGLLKLDSSIKNNSQSFELYYQIRTSRLQQLNTGTIDVDITNILDNGRLYLQITIEDTGAGFDYSSHINRQINTKILAGRGIFIAQALCDELNYINNGRTVIAKYRLLKKQTKPEVSPKVPVQAPVQDSHADISILLVEDEVSTLKFMSLFLEELGYSVLKAENVDIGIEYFQRHQPDIVLTDYNMPGRLGIELVQHIRSKNSAYWTPVLVLSAVHEQENVLNCLTAGADDYLIKPVNLKILDAKIKTCIRLVKLQKENLTTKNALEKAYSEMAGEEILAESLLARILKRNPTDNVPAHYWVKSASRFSGDLISIAKTADNETFIIIADVTGHGLAASLTTLIIAQIFYDMIERHCPLADIVTKINNATYSLLPTNFFAAASIMRLNKATDEIELWSGGLPDILVTDKHGNLLQRLSSQHLALGILPADQFQATTQQFSWPEDVMLTAYSDGIIECLNQHGEKFGEQRLLDAITSANNDPIKTINTIKQQLETHSDGDAFQDDVTALTVKLKAN